jgi:hypothetical protein
MKIEMMGSDVFVRYDGGPVQQLRAWDAPRLFESQVAQGMNAKEPYNVTLATEAEYRAEHPPRRVR